MPRFFISNEQLEDNIITLTGDDAHHIARSLRMAVGETLVLCDEFANEYECTIVGFVGDSAVHAKINRCTASLAEPPVRITLFQALSKGDKLDTVIQKAVECGVSRIVPFESERCVVRVKEDAETRKTERRAKIAAEAAKQSGRGMLPTVSTTVSFDGMLREASESSLALFCYEGEGTQPLGRVLSEKLVPNSDGKYGDVAIIVGSEGGFSPLEAQRAAECGLCPVGLGRRILRTETAPVFALSCVICHTELK